MRRVSARLEATFRSMPALPAMLGDASANGRPEGAD